MGRCDGRHRLSTRGIRIRGCEGDCDASACLRRHLHRDDGATEHRGHAAVSVFERNCSRAKTSPDHAGSCVLSELSVFPDKFSQLHDRVASGRIDTRSEDFIWAFNGSTTGCGRPDEDRAKSSRLAGARQEGPKANTDQHASDGACGGFSQGCTTKRHGYGVSWAGGRGQEELHRYVRYWEMLPCDSRGSVYRGSHSSGSVYRRATSSIPLT